MADAVRTDIQRPSTSDNDPRLVVVNDPQRMSKRVNDMRKQISLRLSAHAISVLEEIEAATGLSQARAVERLLLGEFQAPSPAELYGDGPIQAVKETFETVPPSAEKRVQTQVQDISSTKQVLRRKINPMTGKPFGPVPK